MTSNVLQQPSLTALPQHQQNENGITSALASRYHAQLPIATLSSHALVAFNTFKDASRGVDGGKDGSAHQFSEDLVQRAYNRLGQRSEDQAIVFLYVAPFLVVACPRMANKTQGRIWRWKDDDSRPHAAVATLLFINASFQED